MNQPLEGRHGNVATGIGEAVRTILSDVMEDGHRVGPLRGRSIGHARSTVELLNYTLLIRDPLINLPLAADSPFLLTRAIARFNWAMTSNDRVADIARYDAGVRRFTDNGFTVPGSSYGKRLRYALGGIDQLRQVVEELRRDPFTRRALASIYLPSDAGRLSVDIPCAFGLAFHIRDDALHATVIMRSNNVYRLVGYNLFEFALMAEMVAREVGSSLATLTHHCLSAHVYEDEFEDARRYCQTLTVTESPLGRMPQGIAQFQQVDRLGQAEESLRYARNDLEFVSVLDEARRALDPYWYAYLSVLALALAEGHGNDRSSRVKPLVDPTLRAWLATSDVNPGGF